MVFFSCRFCCFFLSNSVFSFSSSNSSLASSLNARSAGNILWVFFRPLYLLLNTSRNNSNSRFALPESINDFFKTDSVVVSFAKMLPISSAYARPVMFCSLPKKLKTLDNYSPPHAKYCSHALLSFSVSLVAEGYSLTFRMRNNPASRWILGKRVSKFSTILVSKAFLVCSIHARVLPGVFLISMPLSATISKKVFSCP